MFLESLNETFPALAQIIVTVYQYSAKWDQQKKNHPRKSIWFLKLITTTFRVGDECFVGRLVILCIVFIILFMKYIHALRNLSKKQNVMNFKILHAKSMPTGLKRCKHAHLWMSFLKIICYEKVRTSLHFAQTKVQIMSNNNK